MFHPYTAYRFQEVRRKTVARYEKIGLIRNVELSDDVTPKGLKEAASTAYGKKDFEAVLLHSLAGPIIGERDVLNITSKSIFFVAFERKEGGPDLIIVDEETPSASGIISLA